jgi:hypothetical protein
LLELKKEGEKAEKDFHEDFKSIIKEASKEIKSKSKQEDIKKKKLKE